MHFEPQSIADHIECLARLTGAPQAFVIQVKDLFSRKGISLESDATPYLKALEEAFKREEHIRTTTARARQNLARLQDNFSKVGQAYVRQLEHLKKIQARLQESGRSVRGAEHAEGGLHEISVPGGNHRTLVTRQQRDNLPLVPGPDDPQ